jgi:hypothetical protein
MKRRQPSSFRSEFSVIQRCHSTSKNGGATYQKGVQIMLEPQIGRNIEVYIGVVVVKSKKQGDLLVDLRETFNNLHKYQMKLNPKKCVFGVSSRKLLGYMVSARLIDDKPKKVKAIEKLPPP